MCEEQLMRLLEQLKSRLPEQVSGCVSIDADGFIYIEGQTTNNNLVALKLKAEDDHYKVIFKGGYRGDDRFELDCKPLVIHDAIEAAVELSILICDHINEDPEFIKAVIHDKWMDPSDAKAFVDEQLITHSAEME